MHTFGYVLHAWILSPAELNKKTQNKCVSYFNFAYFLTRRFTWEFEALSM